MLSITPVALAKTRQSHLIDFIYNYQNDDESFGISAENTANAIEILDEYNAYLIEVLFEETKSVNILRLKNYLRSEIQTFFNSENVDLYEIYNHLKTLSILESSGDLLNSTLHNKIYNYINNTYQPGGGFSPTNTSKVANMVSTYNVYNIFTLLGETVENESTHKTWILSCSNPDGGYGGNNTLPSTLITTYYAVYLVSALGTVSELVNPTSTLNYFKSLFISDSNNVEHYGGYLPDLFAQTPLLSSTLLCVEGIGLIDENELNTAATSNWVLKRQTFLDGGFSDWAEGGGESSSSIVTSYSAFKILQILDQSSLLDEDIFMVEFNYLILIIVVSVVGVLVVAIYIILRRRRI
jgi:prenyltransferase beta subunit